jgi:transcriptional regulator GlxA family with amidase domain
VARIAPGGSADQVVAVAAFSGVQLLDVTGPAEVFGTANLFGARYDVRIVSPDGKDVRASSGVRIGVDGAPDCLPTQLSTAVVPGRREWQQAVGDATVMGCVAELVGRSQRVVSVCAGAFLLAHMGVLDGRRAATHWRLAGELARRYPLVNVEADPVFVRDGHVITSAGITAGIDLALSLVEDDHGADLARDVARELVVFMARPAGQSQFSARLTLREARHPRLRQAVDAVTADPAAPHNVDALAREVGVSGRHLSRLFRHETGLSPGQYIERARLESAQVLLEAGDEPVEVVADRSGFGSSETMRRAFQHTLGISPSTYRARFRSTRPDR